MFFQCTVRLSVRTTAFHAVKTGSIPVPCTIGWRAELVTAPDCKSGVLWHTGFESLVTHHIEAHYSQNNGYPQRGHDNARQNRGCTVADSVVCFNMVR